ncbi:MAG: SDR family NAD(P)-dependent oxidoreductase [Bacteroidales bacterium]
MINQTAPYTVILGAEGELGRALAKEVARKCCNLILVSTSACDLQRFAIGLQLQTEMQVEARKLDLEQEDAIRELAAELSDNYEIRALINNVSCDWSVTQNRYIPELNQDGDNARLRGAARFTLELVPRMKHHSSSFIQHIIPFPFGKEKFPAPMQALVSKMNGFALELKEMLKDSPIMVSLMHPASPRILLAENDLGSEQLLRPQAPAHMVIARKAIRGMLRGDSLIIPGILNRIEYMMKTMAGAWRISAGEDFWKELQPSL